jgi:PKD repeat protein
MISFRSIVLVLVLSLFLAASASAQCSVSPQSNLDGCRPYNFKVSAGNGTGKTITNYEWFWGDGYNSKGANLNSASHTYTTSGKYKVSLILTFADNSQCTTQLAGTDSVHVSGVSPQFSVTRIDTLFTYQGNDPVNGAILSKTVYYFPIGTSLDKQEGHLGYRNFSINIPYRLSYRKREREGTDILLLPLDSTMPRAVKFSYVMQRREFPAAESWYYHMLRSGDQQQGFWPDSASMNPFRVKPLTSDTDLCRIWARTYNKDSVTSAMQHDSVRMHVPFPGFYTIISDAINDEGCEEIASYHFIHGHFAMFWIKDKDPDSKGGQGGDSIICVRDTVRFQRKVRYWTTNCPPLPSGMIPEGCVSGPGTYDGFITVGGNQVQLYPWDFADPIAYRKTLVPTYRSSTNFRTEIVEWNYGEDNNFYKEGTPGKFGEGLHVYNKPGIYDVTMRSRDSLGYWVYTTRKKLINVIMVNADFAVSPLADTQSICAPKNIVYKDRTRLLGSDKDVPGKFYQARKVIAPDGSGCFSLQTANILMDSILAWTWNPGQMHQAPITRTSTDSLVFDYRANGQYNVSLKVITANRAPSRCRDEELKMKYIRIDGPKPSFHLLDTFGCVPFTARVRNTSASGNQFLWIKGDSTVVQSGSLTKDSIVKLVYMKPGRYKVTLVQTDTVWDAVLNKWVECVAPEWPDPIVDSMEFWVTVCPSGISENQTKAKFKVYPNPSSSGFIIVEGVSGIRLNEVSLHDMLGKKIEVTGEKIANGLRLKLPASIVPGMYVVTILNGGTYTITVE